MGSSPRSNTPLGIPLRSLTASPFHASANGSNVSLASPPSAVYALLTPEETALKLQTSLKHGLTSSQDAIYRRSIHGTNELPHGDDESLYVRFFKQFVESPLILLLLGSAAVSFMMGNMEDAISITLAVVIVVAVGFVQEYRSEKSLEALNKLVPHYAHLVRGRPADGESGSPASSTVMAGQLVPGDLVIFSTGDRIPADIRITNAAGLEIDESNLTGENEPVKKTVEAVTPRDALNPTLSDISVSERTCIAFMGTLVRSGNGQGIVIATGSKTEFGTITAMLAGISKPKTPLQSSMDKLGKDLSYASFGVIGVIVLLGLWQGRGWLDMFQVGVSLAVAAIPEGLPIIVTVTLALGVLRMVRRGGIVRRLPSVETLGCVSVICSDKTGTLTTNHMTPPITRDAATEAIIRIGNLCNNARLSSTSASTVAAAAIGITNTGTDSRFVGHATDVALLDLMDAFGDSDARQRTERVTDIPFSSERKWMGAVVRNEDGERKPYIKGAVEHVLARCDAYLTREGREIVLDEKQRKNALAAAEKMASEGLRVIGFAQGSPIPGNLGNASGNDDPIFRGLTFAGAVGMSDPPRKGVKSAVRRLMRGGVKVMMITGDSETTAVAIARKLGMPILPDSHGHGGIVRPVLKGEDLDAMTDAQLAQAIATTTIFARTSPEHKMKIVRALQSRGEVVAMTGDGVNDAPALKMADIGISMGLQGTDVAKEAADMILTNDDFSTILSAIEEGKGIFYNIQNFLTFQLSTSIAALSLVLLCTFVGLPNPLNPMQILWINILMDGPPAQSLGVEPVDPAVMTRPPRSRNEQILTRPVLLRIFTSALTILLGTIFVYVLEMHDGVVTARDTTMTFTCFVLFDMALALSCRSESKSILKGEIKIFGNKMFNYAVIGCLVGQMAVIYVPGLQNIFQTETLSFKDLGILLAIATSVFWVDEGRKWAQRRREFAGGYSGNV
ncbi:unnamed protein product [Tuber melanosporum]|uniref:Calcium-transporting ATPase n=1 Tax=Tuber melanosporum (strain Mel28) TaxID=656061 RepID=D5GF79_TUBMM|nr:uncharacterized protein GSTUM_00006766001 [Tuber melanosporum]CAZ83172.1 unnamed protein product [Tuber melanosporum]